MSFINTTFLKDAQDIKAYYKQVMEVTKQIEKNIKYEKFRTLQIDEALSDIIYKSQEILNEIDNQL